MLLVQWNKEKSRKNSKAQFIASKLPLHLEMELTLISNRNYHINKKMTGDFIKSSSVVALSNSLLV